MSMADDMKNLCQDIANAHVERIEKVNEIRANANSMIVDFGNERRKMERELRNDLKRYTAGIKKDVQEKLKEFNNNREKMGTDFRNELRTDVNKQKKDTNNKITGFASERKKMGKELNSDLRAYTKFIKTNVNSLIKEFRSARKNTIRDVKESHNAWIKSSKHKSTKQTPSKEISYENIIFTEEKTKLKTMIIDALKNHKKGLTLPELGKEFDVNWRSLTHLVKALKKEKKIEKKGTKYQLK